MNWNRCFVLGVAAVAYGQVYAQPAITEAVNTAGYMKAGLPNGGLAQGSYIAIKGSNLGPAIPSTGIAVSGYPLTTSFSGVSARIGATSLIIVYASPGQVGAIVPSTTPLGAQQLIVTYNNQPSAPFSVQIVDRALGIFTLNQGGSGPAVALKFISQSSQPPSTLIEATNPGGTLTLFGTGLGRSNNPDTAQATDLTIPGLNAPDVEVLIGGKRAPVRFFGRSSCCASIDQIVVDVPADVPVGCYVSLVVRVAGKTSNSTTISVGPAGQTVCEDPNGYSRAQLAAAASKGSFRAGYIGLSKMNSGSGSTPISDTLSGSFHSFNLNQLLYSQGSDFFISNGSCRVLTFAGDNATPVDPIEPTELDAGTSLTARNSNGDQTLEKAAMSKGTYLKSIVPGFTLPPGTPPIPGLPTGGPEYLTTGNHTVRGPGGPDVGSFEASINWPAVFNWTNRDATTTINRSNGFLVNWSGGDPDGFVSITGSSIALVGTSPVGAIFVCIESARAGRFEVPGAITSLLPVTATISGASLGSVSVIGSAKPTAFQTAGPPAPLDSAFITYQSGFSKSVTFQ